VVNRSNDYNQYIESGSAFWLLLKVQGRFDASSGGGILQDTERHPRGSPVSVIGICTPLEDTPYRKFWQQSCTGMCPSCRFEMGGRRFCILRLPSRDGGCTATVVLERFGSAARGDQVHRAGQSLGQLRTPYLCDYFSLPDFRRLPHRVLDRGGVGARASTSDLHVAVSCEAQSASGGTHRHVRCPDRPD
jgi:Tn3 transposase DDE domain